MICPRGLLSKTGGEKEEEEEEGEAGSTLIDRPKDAPVPDFTNGKERVIPMARRL